ncbi:MAG: hypothetical protein Kow0069_39230 [Promethearchaeota archaeon]
MAREDNSKFIRWKGFVWLLVSLASSVGAFLLNAFGPDVYITSALALPALSFPLTHLGTSHERYDRDKLAAYYAYCAVVTFCFLWLVAGHHDFVAFELVVLVAATFWFGSIRAASGLAWTRRLDSSLTAAFRAAASFTGFYLVVARVNAPLRAAQLGLVPRFDGVADALVAVAFLALLAATVACAPYRVAAPLATLAGLLWQSDSIGWVLRHAERVGPSSPGLLLLAFALTGALATLTGALWGRLVAETVRLRNSGKSALLGPWCSSFAEAVRWKLGRARGAGPPPGAPVQGRSAPSLPPVRHGLFVAAVISLVALPGLLVLGGAVRPCVVLEPGTQRVGFNFWATDRLDRDYTPAQMAALNRHRANLDLMTYLTPEKIPLLAELEALMPNVTYRITVIPSNLTQLPGEVRRLTELLMEAESNGTLDQWRGFAFDVEGSAYTWIGAVDSVQDSVAIWEEVFDYLDEKSEERGATIETECVSSAEFAVDQAFDGDLDMQAAEGYTSYVPRRFTLYAPMVYRCWPSGTPPHGSPEKPLDPWRTSYYVYSSLYTLASVTPVEQRGVYLGITNTSCYGRDLPQRGGATGLQNLIDDVLVAKSFGIREVTFFLLFNATDDGLNWYGGTFWSYGDDFLDIVDQAVNLDPPERLVLRYDHLSAPSEEAFVRDALVNADGALGASLAVEATLASAAVLLLTDGRRWRSGF